MLHELQIVLALLAAPAHADVPAGWADVSDVDDLEALGLLLGVPLLLFVLIAVAVYLPAMVRGERLLPDTFRRRMLPQLRDTGELQRGSVGKRFPSDAARGGG